MPFHFPYMSMRAKLIAFALAVLLPIVGLAIFDFQRDGQRHLERELEAQLDTARAVAMLVDATFDGAAGFADALAKEPDMWDPDSAAVSSLFRRMLPNYPMYSHLSLYDSQGQHLTSVFAREGQSPPTVVDQSHFQQALQKGQPALSDIQIEPLTNRSLTILAAPVRNLEDRIVAVLLIGLDLSELSRRVANIDPQANRDIVLTDQAGRIGLHTRRWDMTWEERDGRHWAPVAQALRGETVKMPEFRSPLLGNLRAMAAVRSVRYGWVVGVSREHQAVLAPAWDSLRDHLAWFLPTLGFAGLLAVLLSRSLTAPLRELTSAHSDVQGGYLGRRVDLRTGDEVETLARSFNRTVEQMEKITRERAELEQLRAEFVSMVAHDLRTPLVAIVGWADVLRRSLRDHEELDREQKAIQHLRSSARRLDAMISDLLDVSRIETSRLQLEKERIDLGQFVPEVIERLSEVTKGHPVLVAGSGPGLAVQADPRRIEQILGNLLSNAAKYSYPQTEITVRVWSQERQVCCSVSNQGQGIGPQDQEHLFERYYRGGRPLLTAGLGLGLYITKGLVESHDGRIWVESEPGKSATFTFCLPAAA